MCGRQAIKLPEGMNLPEEYRPEFAREIDVADDHVHTFIAATNEVMEAEGKPNPTVILEYCPDAGTKFHGEVRDDIPETLKETFNVLFESRKDQIEQLLQARERIKSRWFRSYPGRYRAANPDTADRDPAFN